MSCDQSKQTHFFKQKHVTTESDYLTAGLREPQTNLI